MRSWMRLLVVWCMAIALPLQSLAGASMLHCGHAEAELVAQGGHDHVADAPGHHAPHAADHGAHATSHAMAGHTAPHTTADPTADPAPLVDLTPHSCSACAACCAGPALPSAAPRLPQAASAPAAFAALLVAVDRFATDGPDRPPRHRAA